ncbi:hypothetical protein ERO13_D02G146300v2 [Gossypium hirsutum]|uniref:DUF7733 domain-containing protein n=6 Tax=Gossypium TaxID=3633 RepID=A0A1U8JSJ4_GOSHI|nr:uncharacterized protein LOC107910021 [Gossypium hirsutum]KAB2041739.1 hypothetical protein ES319_D02G167800v1 [Gossypium barbadense]MBA0613540.1 hypothetical protein [Gossypium davidsonii]MBA0648741.1 hypothetical protein [Gossypium klotzschianum]TYI94002.1 hypothetical protein E1A91_D02G173900v1 [Gossypium mustelinum]KAG4158920.1 hypothetical protein ERO13_D02G146300v2 [Gossypium hirsutum]
MSGVSLAVAPRSEPDHTVAPGGKSEHQHIRYQEQQPVVGGVMGSLRLIELQLVAFIMVFSISGLVPLLDLVFPAFTSAYLIALSRFAFPSRGSRVSSGGSEEIFRGSRLFNLYVILGTTIGLLLPLAYVLGGFARADDQAVRSATPHLFLLSFQILTENVISGLSLFSPPVRALVPLLYTVRRVFVILDWVHDTWVNKTLPYNAPSKDIAWDWFGKGLSAANLMYFAINLLCFLIPRFLPRAFERYFRETEEFHQKMSEDKRGKSNTPPNKSRPTDRKMD